ncbi:hypothetical protein [Sphingobacterium corticibacter]|uniref:Lipocalin-like domain-containing protein n=1 Tax=Sphingobacterium corticibacter TaxID=2171749 RepID=A0A2T8HI81_9SPHI|nr:hypothetical protein [Sphingobacterium corticibacter]PVH25032.1 hypothetical protein DC487_08845 [Sphingobacterium corticibacter]
MTLLIKTFTTAILALISISEIQQKQQSELFKKWRIVADEMIYLNLDGTPHQGYRDRIDSIKAKDAFFEFRPNGDFRSIEGDGTYILSGDSVHLKISGEASFKYVLQDSSLYLYSDSKRTDYIRREVLHAKSW